MQVTPREPFVKPTFQPDHEVSGIIGLSGKAKGGVVLSLSREAAFSVSEPLSGERPTEIDHDVTDAVGEAHQYHRRKSKAKLEHLALSVSLPTVIVGQGHVMGFPQTVSPVCIQFDCPWGYVAVEVGLIE